MSVWDKESLGWRDIIRVTRKSLEPLILALGWGLGDKGDSREYMYILGTCFLGGDLLS